MMDSTYWHDYYENKLTETEKHAVNQAFLAVSHVFDEHGINGAGDDRAEILASHITEYMITSQDRDE